MAWQIRSSCPISLLPVRLETRFVGTDLLIRIYPDVIHIDSHESELTDAEVAAGKAYWLQLWQLAGRESGNAAAAWRTLAAAYGAERAAWIARVLRPTDAAWPTASSPGSTQTPANPSFPVVATRSASWSRPPLARVLPTRWIAAAWLGDTVARGVSSPVSPNLPAGPDPGAGSGAPAWLTDFAAAQSAGMALRLALPAQIQALGIDRLLVYGVDEQSSAEMGARELSELLDAHYYSGGLAYVTPGASTRNTEATSSVYNHTDPNYAPAFTVSQNDTVPANADSGAKRLTCALGIATAEQPGPVATRAGLLGYDVHVQINAYDRWLAERAPAGTALSDWLSAEGGVRRGQGRGIAVADGGGATEETAVRAMHSALWAGTLGYYMSQILAGASGDDAQDFDHRNIVRKNAYFRWLEREQDQVRDWLQGQLTALANLFESAGGYPQDQAQTAAIGVQSGNAYYQGILSSLLYSEALGIKEARVGYWVQGMTPDPQDIAQANQNLADATAAQAKANWQARGAPAGGALDDWLGAERNLLHDRTAVFAYFRWLQRAANGDTSDERLDDWLVGEAAALYSDLTVQAARRHFATHVRPGGTLPVLRIANQPYGFLPIVALDRWAPGPGEKAFTYVVKTLQGLRDAVWIPATARVPRVGIDLTQSVADAQQTLLQLLAMAPASMEYFGREQLGLRYLTNLWRFTNLDLQGNWIETLTASSSNLLQSARIGWEARAARMVSSDAAVPISSPLVLDASGNLAWLGTFVDTLASKGWQGLQKMLESGADATGTPLLFRLLRHSALREYATAATRIQARAGTLGSWEHLEPEFVDILVAGPTATVWRQLERPWNGATIGGYLDAGNAADPDLADLRNFKDALGVLAALPAQTLERNLTIALDSSSHRLDAWLTSIASARLAQLRSATPAGTYLGAYAWVEDLRPAVTRPDSDGFIHAPSLAQAVTGAVLRSGYSGNSGGSTNPFAINLASDRVRTADWLLEGMRNGQTLSSLGGYLVEQALHDAGADQYIAPLRVLAPPRSTSLPASGAPYEVVGAPNTIDGVALMKMWQASAPALMTLVNGIADAAQKAAVQSALGLLDAALDAVGDALMAEAVHHAVNGNPSRAAATLDALARGDGAIPQLDFQRTPRTGIALSHRLAILVPLTATRAAGWAALAPGNLRAAAAPQIEALISNLLPNPSSVRCTLTAAGGAASDVRLSDCVLGALDCVYETANVPPGYGLADLPPALVAAVQTAAGPGTIDWSRQTMWAATDMSFTEFTALCRTVRQLLQTARAARASDLSVPGGTAPLPAADPGLASRADALATALRTAAAQIGQAGTIAAALSAAWAMGVSGAAEAVVQASPAPSLVAGVAAELARRLAALNSAQSAIGSTASDADQIARIQAVLGRDFIVGPGFVPSDVSAWSAGRDFAANVSQQAARSWLQRCARVRQGAGALNRLLVAATATGISTLGNFNAVQLPANAGEPWIGGPIAPGQISGSRRNLVLLGAVPDGTAAMAGITFDDWVETLPASEETTGLAFHFETPIAQAPQSALLAVAADPAQEFWSADLLESTLLEALQLAKMRAVDPDCLFEVGQMLPALYFANNMPPSGGAPDTVSTEFYPATS
jgi:hypothetical protein